MVEVQGLVLTDDEVVSLAVDSGRPWVGVLPTVDQLDAEELARAAIRGQRSLHVRELIDAQQLARLNSILACGVRVAAYVQDFAGDMVAGSFAVYAFGPADGGDWVRDAVTPVGVHYLAEVSPDDVVGTIASMVSDASDHERDFIPPGCSLVVVWPTDDGFQMSSVSRDGVVVRAVSTDTVRTVEVKSDATTLMRDIHDLAPNKA